MKKQYIEFLKLKGRMAEKNIGQAELSKELCISIGSLNKKLKGKTDFWLKEIINICKILEIETNEVNYYFFDDVLRKK